MRMVRGHSNVLENITAKEMGEIFASKELKPNSFEYSVLELSGQEIYIKV